MKYVHVDTFTAQRPKYPGQPCGDVISTYRDEISTIILFSDGIGSGVKAGIFARHCNSRLMGLVSSGASVYRAFKIMVSSMNRSWGTDDPFAAFCIARILLNGETTVLSYEMPEPLIVTGQYAHILNGMVSSEGNAVIRESHTVLKASEGLLLLSDGISQAGLGRGYRYGWGSEGVARYLTSLSAKDDIQRGDIAVSVLNEALSIWGKKQGDDCSVLYAGCRNGVIVNVFTGPPASERHDASFVKRFLSEKGFRIVCGGTTAKIIARETGHKLEVAGNSGDHITPAAYRIDDIDLVTEGMVTLNQACNILDEDIENEEDDSPVYELVRMLNLADRVNIYCGTAVNLSEQHLVFRRQGLSPRHDIVRLLVDKLRDKGKLVVLKNEFEN